MSNDFDGGGRPFKGSDLDVKAPGYFSGLALKAFSQLQHGRLSLELPDGARHVFGSAGRDGLHAVASIRKWRALRRLATGGTLGLARSYMDGDWTTPDLTGVFDLAIANEGNSVVWNRGHRLGRMVNRLAHLWRGNSRRGSRRNIAYHYDLGNSFYERWLGPTMAYSSAYYTDGTMSLEDAQRAKFDRIIDLGEIGPGDSVLEIGSGWGGFARHAAGYGARVHGITVSKAQLGYSMEKSRSTPAELKPEFSFTDYRDVEGRFDRIVSIEMLEAVGEQYWPDYFRVLRDRLKSGGVALIQVIVIDDSRFEAYRRSTDFIQKYIFPGGLLLSRRIMQDMSARAGLVLEETEFFRHSYARTLAEWNRRFQDAWPELAQGGFDDQFKRMWEFYLSYCEAGFKAGNIDVGWFKIRKPA